MKNENNNLPEKQALKIAEVTCREFPSVEKKGIIEEQMLDGSVRYVAFATIVVSRFLFFFSKKEKFYVERFPRVNYSFFSSCRCMAERFVNIDEAEEHLSICIEKWLSDYSARTMINSFVHGR